MPTNKARTSDNAQKQSASNAIPIFYSDFFLFFVKQVIILMEQTMYPPRIVLPSKVYRLRIVSVLFPLPEARTIGER